MLVQYDADLHRAYKVGQTIVCRTSLRYLRLLRTLYDTYGYGDFDARDVSDRLSRREFGGVFEVPDTARSRQYSVKYISIDLARLKKMTFLAGRKVKRQVRTRTGKSCSRGQKWIYKLSNQGLSYLKAKDEENGLSHHLANMTKKRVIDFMIEDPVDRNVMYGTQLKEKRSSKPGVAKRFPAKKGHDEVTSIWKLGGDLKRVSEMARTLAADLARRTNDLLEADKKVARYKQLLSMISELLDLLEAKSRIHYVGGSKVYLMPQEMVAEMRAICRGEELI